MLAGIAALVISLALLTARRRRVVTRGPANTQVYEERRYSERPLQTASEPGPESLILAFRLLTLPFTDSACSCELAVA